MAEQAAELEGAMAAVAAVLASIEESAHGVEAELALARRKRRELLDGETRRLLPAIAPRVLDALRLEAPAFAADDKVLAAFAGHGKWLWIFKRPGYDASLALLQAQLKAFLEKAGYTRAHDERMQSLEQQLGQLDAQQAEALEMLGVLERARRSGGRLPDDVTHDIRRLAGRGRTARQLPGGAQPSLADANDSPAGLPSDANADGWLWLMADIPGSFRTTVLAACTQHSPVAGQHGTPPLPAAGLGQELAASGAARCDIATDDRLGAFS